jgi:hypothetical protein
MVARYFARGKAYCSRMLNYENKYCMLCTLIINKFIFRLKKNRNYNLWTYRLSLITKDQAALRKEVQFCQDPAGQQIHNHSLFLHLMIMLRLNDSSLNQSDLLIRFTLMYEGQENPQELHIVNLSSLKRFVEILSKTKWILFAVRCTDLSWYHIFLPSSKMYDSMTGE